MKQAPDCSKGLLLDDALNIRTWPDLVVPLIQAVNTDAFGDAFFDSINRIAPIDSALIMLFRVDQEPVILFERLHPAERAYFEDVYLGGAYLLSPLYRRFESLRSGFYRLGSLEHQDFKSSDFGLAYFNESGLCDDANFLHKIDQGSALVASFGRQQLQLPFSDQELQSLHVAEPVYRSALSKHWAGERLLEASAAKPSDRGHNVLSSALQRFASSILTEREQTVLALMIEGKPSKTSARELQISVDTERGHRKNIYTKLKVSSQAQLFSLIFDVLSKVALEDQADPYAAFIAIGP
jgi:DNA-binding CsgD family transcriptional regulator